MFGTKEICALLLAGGMGAGSVVAVQHAKPGISRAKPKKAHKSVERSVRQTQISDCPASAVLPPVGVANFDPVLVPEELQPEVALRTSEVAALPNGDSGLQLPPLLGGGSGSGTNILPPSPIPGVPQPHMWTMMVAGFGFIGLALRRPGRRTRQQR